MLSPLIRKYLKAQAHHLKPVVSIGKDGVTEAVLAEIEATAKNIELLKIKIHSNAPQSILETLASLQSALCGEIVGRIGGVVIYFLPGKTPTRYPMPGGHFDAYQGDTIRKSVKKPGKSKDSHWQR